MKTYELRYKGQTYTVGATSPITAMQRAYRANITGSDIQGEVGNNGLPKAKIIRNRRRFKVGEEKEFSFLIKRIR
jgi:hypothetical protein